MNAQLVAIMAKIAALQAYVEGLKADNAAALARGEKQPRDGKDFASLASSFFDLARDAEAVKQSEPPQCKTWVGLPESAFAAMTLQQVSAMKHAELVLKEKNT